MAVQLDCSETTGPFAIAAKTGRRNPWHSEKSVRFGESHVDSNALFGRGLVTDLAAHICDSGRTLLECISDVCDDIERVQNEELHIKRGRELVAREARIGVAAGGNNRHCAIGCVSHFAPFGAVPRWLRFAAAELIDCFHRYSRAPIEHECNLVKIFSALSFGPSLVQEGA